MAERELTEAVDLCTPDGALNPDAVGWSRKPLHNCALHGSWGRRKRWDFWGITGANCAMNIVAADVDYIGLTGLWFRDFASGRTIEKGSVSPLGRAIDLPDTVGGGSILAPSRSLELSISEEEEGTRIRASSGKFEADLVVLRPPGHESLGVVIPWTKRRFQYTNKDVSRPVRGRVQWGHDTYELSWGFLDFGRGKWPYRTHWNWGAGAGTCNGVRVGLQIGGKWTDGTGMTENALCVDGKLSKISDELVWSYDTTDWLKPWTIRSERVDLTFTPNYDKPARLNLGFASQRVDQCFGTYNGTVIADDGRSISCDALFGWAEEATWRW